MCYDLLNHGPYDCDKKPVGIHTRVSPDRLLTVEPNTPENLETVRKWLKIARVHLRENSIYIPPQHLDRVKIQLQING